MPYGKFVGVRGKKVKFQLTFKLLVGLIFLLLFLQANDGSLKRLRLDDDDLNQGNGLRAASRVASDTTQDKRIGFIGMRG